MKKVDIRNKIDELEKQLAELKEQIKLIKNEEINGNIRRIPAEGDKYYYLNDFGEIGWANWTNDKIDLFRFNTDNCFKTKEKVKEYKENLLIKQALKNLALELNNGVRINWDCSTQYKYYILYNNEFKKLTIGFNQIFQCSSKIYCINPNFLDKAKERIGEKKLIKLIKSGV